MWIRTSSNGAISPELSWTGFGISQSIVILSLLFGAVAWRTSELFPFAKRYPRMARASKGLFGLSWIQKTASDTLRKAGELADRQISSPIWEKFIPRATESIVDLLRTIGRATESRIDEVTGNRYGRLLSPAAKLVQWLHSGNVRIYGWFALVWILIFSIYLTR